MSVRKCILDDGKLCTGCGECDMCDLDPEKVCDNCMECVKSGADYLAVEIDEVFMGEEADDEGP